MSFKLAFTPLDPESLKRTLLDPRSGACVTFDRIIAEAARKFDVLKIAAFHRVGSLQIGDLAVWVGVAAAHRGPAFDACRYVIDEAKARLPVWKKEHYVTGASEWINCATAGHPSAG
jgi:molybdopterin synthase catalytic subunit